MTNKDAVKLNTFLHMHESPSIFDMTEESVEDITEAADTLAQTAADSGHFDHITFADLYDAAEDHICR